MGENSTRYLTVVNEHYSIKDIVKTTLAVAAILIPAYLSNLRDARNIEDEQRVSTCISNLSLERVIE